MEVQVQFMMIKKDMKSLYVKLFLLLGCILNTIVLYGQNYKQLKEKVKLVATYQNQGNWEAAANIINKLATIPDDSLKDSTRDFKGKALFCLGHFYLHAHYYNYDLKKAISYFERASEYDIYDLPELYLTLIYNDGRYGVCDYNKSLYWLEKGCKRRPVLKYLLGEVYAFGFTHFLIHTGGAMNTFEFSSTILAFPNVEKDMRKTYQLCYEFYQTSYYIMSEKKISEYDIAVAFMDGTYFPKDYEIAYEYFINNVPTFEDLQEDISIHKNPKTADALYRLSQMYRFGYGTTANEHRANQYLKYAALCGNKKAQSVISSKNIDMGD